MFSDNPPITKITSYASRYLLLSLKMTKLFSIVILYKGDPSAHILKAGHDLTSISYFQRSTAENFIMFTSKILVERTGLGARQSVKEAEYMCHVFVRSVEIMSCHN